MLNGEVNIRDQNVIKWEAECVEPTYDLPGFWDYNVHIKGDVPWTGGRFDVNFIVPHQRNSGQHLLVASIMMELESHLPKRETE